MPTCRVVVRERGVPTCRAVVRERGVPTCRAVVRGRGCLPVGWWSGRGGAYL